MKVRPIYKQKKSQNLTFSDFRNSIRFKFLLSHCSWGLLLTQAHVYRRLYKEAVNLRPNIFHLKLPLNFGPWFLTYILPLIKGRPSFCMYKLYNPMTGRPNNFYNLMELITITRRPQVEFIVPLKRQIRKKSKSVCS